MKSVRGGVIEKSVPVRLPLEALKASTELLRMIESAVTIKKRRNIFPHKKRRERETRTKNGRLLNDSYKVLLKRRSKGGCTRHQMIA